MSKNQYLGLTGAQLRELALNGDDGAKAEQGRRQAKRVASGKVTVAAARSWGYTNAVDAAQAMNGSIPHKPEHIPVPEVKELFSPELAPAFKRTTKAELPKREPLTKGGLTLLSVDKRLRTVEGDVSAIKSILAKYAH